MYLCTKEEERKKETLTSTGVVKLKCDSQITVSRKTGDIATGRIDEVEPGGVAVDTCLLLKDPKVVAVQVNRVEDAEARIVLDDKHGPLWGSIRLRLVNRDDVVVQGESGVAFNHLQQGGVLPVQFETAAVDGPLEPGAAGGEVDLLIDVGRQVADVQGELWNEARYRLVVAGPFGGDARVGGRLRGAAGIVAHDTSDSIRVAIGAAGVDPLRAKPVIASFGVGLNDDIVPLTIRDGNGVGGIRNKGNKIVADNSQAMAVDGELEVAVRGSVDQTETVLLAGLEHSLILGATVAVRVCAVDEAVFHGGRTTGLDRIPKSKGLCVGPVTKEEGTEVLVVVGTGWAV